MISQRHSQRKRLNKQVTELRRVMSDRDRFEESTRLFLEVHAQLHTAGIADGSLWSFEDAVMDDLDETTFQRIPKKMEHSIAWCLWHIARIEDIAMNILVADQEQIYHQNGWVERLDAPRHDTGNAMGLEAVAELSQAIDLYTLRAYRREVGQRTRQIVKSLSNEDLRQPVQPSRLQRVWDAGALVKAAQGIADYWARQDIAGLLLMPATRHCLTHLNEAHKLKHRRT